MKNSPSKTDATRRDFLKSSAAAGSFLILPRRVLGGSGYTAPSDKLNVAGIGVGGMGKNNLKNVGDENIVALCDVDDERARETYELFPDAKRYKDFRVMLEKQKDIDAVIVATPDNTHAVAAVAAIQSGKHVYVQKPLTHDIYEARKLAEAAREAKVATQMGNQGHSGEGVRLICEWIWDGAIGPVREVHAWTDRPGRFWEQGCLTKPTETPKVPKTLDWDLWLGPAPERPYHPVYAPHDWRAWWGFGCGALGDMGCHVMDPIFTVLKLGYPTYIEASSTKNNGETYPHASIVRYQFPAREDMPPVKVIWHDGGLMPERPEELEPGREMGNGNSGVIFIGETGKLMCGEYGDSPRIIPEAKMREYKRPPRTLPRVEATHEDDWVRACKGGDQACSNFDYSGPMTEVVLLGNLAIRAGEKIYWDGPNMTATNMPELDQFVRRQYREGWTL